MRQAPDNTHTHKRPHGNRPFGEAEPNIAAQAAATNFFNTLRAHHRARAIARLSPKSCYG
jgi:hypothetical protein